MRAQRWLVAKQLATTISRATPAPGDNFASMPCLAKLVVAAMIALPLVGRACDYPDEGTMPLHRAVTKVKLRPETEQWSAEMLRNKASVQYALMLDEPVRIRGRCYWTLDARADGRTWRRFFVTPDGRRVVSETAGRPRA